MSDYPTAQDGQEEYDDWLKDYEQVEYLENTPENWEKVQAVDTHLVWTDHGTCDNPMVSSGARMYSGRCCWDTYGWYVMAKPWVGDPEDTFISVETSAYLPCTLCNADGEEEEINDECEECEGDGWVNHFFD